MRATGGNVSARAGDLIAMTPTGSELETMTPAQVSVVDLAGAVADGEFPPTSELGLHLGVYERYGAGAVVHTHAPTATALSCVLDELPCVHYEMAMLGGAVRVARYETFGTAELARAALDGLEGRRAVLLANHGTITYGDDLDQAVQATELLEWAALVYWRAAAVGTPRTLGPDELSAVVEAMAERRRRSPA